MPASRLQARIARLLLAFTATQIHGVVSRACAHEFWIEPSTFHPAVGDALSVGLMVGDGFPGEPRQRKADRIEKFEAAQGGAVAAVAGEEGATPAGQIAIKAAGPHILGYLSTSTLIVLEAEKFEAYLKEDGLDNALEARRVQGKSGAEGRERYTRCAKSIVCVPGDTDHQPAALAFDHTFGFPLEIAVTSNLCSIRAGDQANIRVIASGKPVAGLLVMARNRTAADGHTPAATARTNADGTATFKLDKPGMWLLSTVQMRPASPTTTDADWESFWASLTFDVPGGRDHP